MTLTSSLPLPPVLAFQVLHNGVSVRNPFRFIFQEYVPPLKLSDAEAAAALEAHRMLRQSTAQLEAEMRVLHQRFAAAVAQQRVAAGTSAPPPAAAA